MPPLLPPPPQRRQHDGGAAAAGCSATPVCSATLAASLGLSSVMPALTSCENTSLVRGCSTQRLRRTSQHHLQTITVAQRRLLFIRCIRSRPIASRTRLWRPLAPALGGQLHATSLRSWCAMQW